MRIPCWALLAAGLAAAGCGREEAPDYASLESRVLAEALKGLRGGDPGASLASLERLGDVSPDSRLPDLALAHERDRRLVVSLNEHLEAGRLAEACRILREQRRFGDMGTSLMEWSGLPDALRALQVYLGGKPYVSSGAQRKALSLLDGHRALLDRSAVFASFLGAEEIEAELLAEEERRLTGESLTMDLDHLVLAGDPAAGLLLAEILAIGGPEHPLPRTVTAVATGDWRTLREIAEGGEHGLHESQYLEIAFALFWDELSDEVRRALGKALVRLPPCTLSGLLLHARYAALDGRMDDAVAYLRELSSSVRVTPPLVGRAMESFVLSRQAFAAPCWQTPCPSVGDVLGRIEQLRIRLRDDGRSR